MSQFSVCIESFFIFVCLFDHISQWMRHLVYNVLETSKELPSLIRPMLVSVSAYFHQGSNFLFSFSFYGSHAEILTSFH